MSQHHISAQQREGPVPEVEGVRGEGAERRVPGTAEADHAALPGEQVGEGGPGADDGQAAQEQGAGVQGSRTSQT